MFALPPFASPHYGPEAILKDPEQSEIIIQLLKGLMVFEFMYDFASARLTSWDASVLQMAGIWSRDESPPTAVKGSAGTKTFLSRLNPFAEERISPPPSDFLVTSALDRYGGELTS